MVQDEIFNCTLETVSHYPVAVSSKIAKDLINDNIATRKMIEKEKKIYVGERGDDNVVSYCLKQNHSLVKYIENWEYYKNYRFSILFSLSDGFNIKEKMKSLVDNSYVNEFKKDGEFEQLRSTPVHPSILEDNNEYYLKFSMLLSGNDSSGKLRKKRNTAVIKINKNNRLLELRFDSIETMFDYEKPLFIKQLVSWIYNYIDEYIEPIDLSDIVEYIMKHGKDDNVIVSEQCMKLKEGSEATIGIGKSINKKLPFIDEMKEMLRCYDKELDNAPNFKKQFEDYIFEREEMSTYPWITFSFLDKRIEVKFTKNYNGMGIYLIQHFSSNLQKNIGKERMDYVTEYIINIKKNIDRLSN